MLEPKHQCHLKPKRLLTCYQYLAYRPIDISIYSSFDQPYLTFDGSTNRFAHQAHENSRSLEAGDADINIPRLIIYMIPGNPGLIEFYDDFLLELCQNLNHLGGCEIVCSAHPGHSIRYNSNLDLRFLENFRLKTLSSDPTLNLAGHVEYHCEVVGNILNDGIGDSTQTSVFIIGHSVGAYIATKVLERFSDRVMHSIGLFPTISHIAQSPKGRRLTPLFSPILLPFINLLQITVCALLPKAIICRLIVYIYNLANNLTPTSSLEDTKNGPQIKNKMSEKNVMVILEFILNINCVTAVLTMARSEMRSILDLDKRFIERFHKKSTLIWTSYGKDDWVAEREVSEIINLLDSHIQPNNLSNDHHHLTNKETCNEILGSKLGHDLASRTDQVDRLPFWKRMSEGVTHDYCLEHNEVMAKECSQIIEKMLI